MSNGRGKIDEGEKATSKPKEMQLRINNRIILISSLGFRINFALKYVSEDHNRSSRQIAFFSKSSMKESMLLCFLALRVTVITQVMTSLSTNLVIVYLFASSFQFKYLLTFFFASLTYLTGLVWL